MKQKLQLELIKTLLKKEGEEGFSLIELVVVVAVLAVLAAIAIPTFQDFTLRARRAGAMAFVDVILKSSAVYSANTGRLRRTWDEIYEYTGGIGNSSNSELESCVKYNSQCNGNERVILNGQYLINFFVNDGPVPNYPNDSSGNMLAVTAFRFNNVGPTSENMHVMACLTRNRGARMYAFNEGVYWQGAAWWGQILDNEGQVLRLCD